MGKRDVRLHPQDRQTQRSEKLSGPAQTLDRGTHLRLAQLLQTTLQRLRTPPQLSRNHDSHRLRPPTPQAIHLVFRQVLTQFKLFFSGVIKGWTEQDEQLILLV